VDDYDFNELTTFAEVMRRGSLAAASKSLGLPKSTVGRRIARLESRLDIVLFKRDGRRASATKEAQALLSNIAARLDLAPDYVVPAFEDPAEWLVKEGQLPDNVTPTNSELEDPEARARIATVFDRGLTTPTGYVLPVQRWNMRDEGRRWLSEVWRVRRGHLFLVPGDSPVGYRLPLGGLPHLAETAYPYVYPTDPAAPHPNMPDFAADQADRLQPVTTVRSAQAPAQQAQQVSAIEGMVRTALSVEPRAGHICVFLPPTETLEDYLELVAAAEAAARDLGLPVQIEGYAPPSDPRLNVIRVAPDPGVIEVNIHPAHNWEDCVATTNAVYDEARQCRLGADKFMIDGKLNGTGGGNHVVVGGASTYDSPFLRRPDVLKSLVLH